MSFQNLVSYRTIHETNSNVNTNVIKHKDERNW